MANEFYITAGLTAIDKEDIATVAANAFYITAGLTANDYEAEPEGNVMLLLLENTMGGDVNRMTGVAG